MNWLMTRAPLLRSRVAWRTIWRLYIWIVCDCRRNGIWSSTGGRCDACGRSTARHRRPWTLRERLRDLRRRGKGGRDPRYHRDVIPFRDYIPRASA